MQGRCNSFELAVSLQWLLTWYGISLKNTVESRAEGLHRLLERLSLTLRGRTENAKMKLLPSVFSSLNTGMKIFEFVANSRRHFSTFM